MASRNITTIKSKEMAGISDHETKKCAHTINVDINCFFESGGVES
jgi:hypothetical protein